MTTPGASTPPPDVIVLMTDQERAIPPYESDAVRAWREQALPGRRWFDEHAVSFDAHYTGSLACVPSRPTLFTGQYPDVHGVTQTDGLGKDADDPAMRWLRPGEVPTLGHWFRGAGYDTHYVGKWHLSHADLHDADGNIVATNDDDGVVDDDAVAAYLAADALDPFGFSGWVGPEPHGGLLANSGLRRDGLYADRATAWLTDRYTRRAAGDTAAARPFLFVVSFVNPHDIVLFPAWSRNSPLPDDEFGTPTIDAPPTADEDLVDKPASQRAYRDAYESGYAPIADGIYTTQADEYRRLYYRLHAQVDEPLERVRRAITDQADRSTVLVRTSDHGELLGAHGGLHQKWFNLYDEAARVPFSIAVTGPAGPTLSPRRVADMVTSHVDLVPTLLGMAGIDVSAVGEQLRPRFSEFHPLPGADLTGIVVGSDSRSSAPTNDRAVYLMTRDHILEGESGASVVARAFGLAHDPPDNMRIATPVDVASNFEAVVTHIDGHRWKLARTFDDPAAWVAQGVFAHRDQPLADEWELYDLTADPIERHNRWADASATLVRERLVERLQAERERCVPARHRPWPYEPRTAPPIAAG